MPRAQKCKRKSLGPTCSNCAAGGRNGRRALALQFCSEEGCPNQDLNDKREACAWCCRHTRGLKGNSGCRCNVGTVGGCDCDACKREHPTPKCPGNKPDAPAHGKTRTQPSRTLHSTDYSSAFLTEEEEPLSAFARLGSAKAHLHTGREDLAVLPNATVVPLAHPDATMADAHAALGLPLPEWMPRSCLSPEDAERREQGFEGWACRNGSFQHKPCFERLMYQGALVLSRLCGAPEALARVCQRNLAIRLLSGLGNDTPAEDRKIMDWIAQARLVAPERSVERKIFDAILAKR